jgi:hypothetical protein
MSDGAADPGADPRLMRNRYRLIRQLHFTTA